MFTNSTAIDFEIWRNSEQYGNEFYPWKRTGTQWKGLCTWSGGKNNRKAKFVAKITAGQASSGNIATILQVMSKLKTEHFRRHSKED